MKLVLLLLTASALALSGQEQTAKTGVQKLARVMLQEGEVPLLGLPTDVPYFPILQPTERYCDAYFTYNAADYVGVRGKKGASLKTNVFMGPGDFVSFEFLATNLVPKIVPTTWPIPKPKARFVWNAQRTELSIVVTLAQRDYDSLRSCTK